MAARHDPRKAPRQGRSREMVEAILEERGEAFSSGVSGAKAIS